MLHKKPGPSVWLLLRRTTEETDLKYYVSNANAETPWQHIALAVAARSRVIAMHGYVAVASLVGSLLSLRFYAAERP